jgi:TonB family protein
MLTHKDKLILTMNLKLKHLILLTLLFSSFLIYGQQTTENDKVYLITDDRELYVYFHGGKDGKTSDSLLLKYLSENIIYPDSAYKAKIEGKIFVSFTIDCKGQISNIKITKGCNPYFDKEVIRLISSMPNWIWEEKIKMTDRMTTTRTLPISFKLK